MGMRDSAGCGTGDWGLGIGMGVGIGSGNGMGKHSFVMEGSRDGWKDRQDRMVPWFDDELSRCWLVCIHTTIEPIPPRKYATTSIESKKLVLTALICTYDGFSQPG